MHIIDKLKNDRKLVKRIKHLLNKFNFKTEHYIRYVSRIKIKEYIKNKFTDEISILEISESEYWKDVLNYKKFSGTNFSEFDICSDSINEKFDLIIADNVWEHLKYPYRASKNVQKMLKPNGTFLIIVPFLVRKHDLWYLDCSRWTEEGLKYFLEETGFEINKIETGSWGNKECVISNLKDDKWKRVGFYKNLKNEKDFPVQVWAFASL